MNPIVDLKKNDLFIKKACKVSYRGMPGKVFYYLPTYEPCKFYIDRWWDTPRVKSYDYKRDGDNIVYNNKAFRRWADVVRHIHREERKQLEK